MKRLVIYLAITFGLTWGLLIPAGFVLGTFQNGESSSVLMIGLIALSMFFPLIGALVANFACKTEERINLAWRPLVGQNIRYYLAAWFAPAGIVLLGAVVFFALNPQWFDPTMRSYIETTAAAAGLPVDELVSQMPPVPVLIVATLASALTYAPFINMIPAFGEELGWRGMLFPTLAEHMSERNAALVSGAIWGLWHAPAIAMGHNYGMVYAGFPVAGILTMTLTCTAMACWLSLLRQRSGSVWPCALAHGAFNAIANIGVVFCANGQTLLGPSPLGLVASIPLVILGIFCWLRLSPSKQPALYKSQRFAP
ncbi:MAG: CPBP family intramembrane metalloprotease [Eggerthellaceae bacterium]|nr:CPBP family intramembrane metalloprotease [Eggerthellaceae bacterium]